mmetsp:Transcript_30401/g.51214  ORF Transcript_30401/g.51214 Transcript_30401/m.51214 type:complete len:264 (+) Transcript_30401:355-1146(+)
MQHHCQHHRGLHDRELVAHTLADPAPKRQVRKVGGDLVGVEALDQLGVESIPSLHLRVFKLLFPAHRVEGVGLVPEVLRVVQVPHRNEHIRALQQLDLLIGFALRQFNFLDRPADQDRGLRVQAQRFRHRESHHLQAHELIVGRADTLLRAHHLVHLCLNLRHDIRVGGEQIGRPREHGGGGLVTRHKHGHQVVTQLLVGGLLPSEVHQEAQQRGILHICVVHVLQVLEIGGGAVVIGLADQLGQHVVHQLQIRLEPPLPRDH